MFVFFNQLSQKHFLYHSLAIPCKPLSQTHTTPPPHVLSNQINYATTTQCQDRPLTQTQSQNPSRESHQLRP